MAFEIGRFYYGIREYENALGFYRDSSENVGQHHVTFHNMGLCYYSMGETATGATNSPAVNFQIWRALTSLHRKCVVDLCNFPDTRIEKPRPVDTHTRPSSHWVQSLA